MHGARIKIHIKGFHHLYCPPNITGVIMASMGERRDPNGIIAAKCARREPLGRPRYRCNDNI
jgi:hypothetical protein